MELTDALLIAADMQPVVVGAYVASSQHWVALGVPEHVAADPAELGAAASDSDVENRLPPSL